MTTLIYSNGVIYSDSKIQSKHIDQRSIEELQIKRDEAFLRGDEFETLLLDCQLESPFLGEDGTSQWAKQHGKFYWFKGEHYFGDCRLHAVGIAGNMMGYSLAHALDIFALENEIDIPIEMEQIKSVWVNQVGEDAGFEFFFITDGGIIVQDYNNDFFFLSKEAKESFVFGSGRSFVNDYSQEIGGESFALLSRALEDFYGTDLKPETIISRVPRLDKETNMEWVKFEIE